MNYIFISAAVVAILLAVKFFKAKNSLPAAFFGSSALCEKSAVA